MKILHLRASNFYGGPERQLHFHARLARGTAYEVIVGSFTESGRRPEFVDVVADDGLPTQVFTVRSAYDTRAVSDIRTYCRENKIDILCTHDYRTTLIGYLAARRLRSSWLAFSRGFTQDNLKVRLYHALDKYFIRFADHVIAVSHSQKKKLRRLFIRDRDISVVHNAIDPAGFTDVPAVDLRTRYGFPDDAIICMSGGRFSREKGQRFLVEAAMLTIKANPRLRFVLYGDGPDYDEIKALGSSSGHSEEIICPGFERNLLGCMKGADLLINPSLSEGLPNIVLEAMALGVPAIATNVGGVPELVTDRKSGFLVPPADSTALAQAIVKAAEDPETMKHIADEALSVVEKAFSFQTQFDKLKALYDRFGPRTRPVSHTAKRPESA